MRNIVCMSLETNFILCLTHTCHSDPALSVNSSAKTGIRKAGNRRTVVSSTSDELITAADSQSSSHHLDTSTATVSLHSRFRDLSQSAGECTMSLGGTGHVTDFVVLPRTG